MDSIKDKIILLTGSSAGIGAALAKRLVKDGAKVVGLARRKDRLEAIQKELEGEAGKFYPCQADLMKEEDILQAYKWTLDNVGPVEIVINNAGVIRNGRLAEGSIEHFREVMETNFMAVVISCKEAIQIMKAHNIDGYIINISSTAAHYPTMSDLLNVYPSSKHALKIYTENLRLELAKQKSKIRISSMSPGGVATEIAIAGGLVTEELLKNLPKDIRVLSPDDVVRCVMFMLSLPPLAHITELILRPLGEGA
nr:farnesol dehydrogenase-like [Onthophagus taurus]